MKTTPYTLTPPSFKIREMERHELISYICKHDPYFMDADFDKYSNYELMIIKVSIDVEKMQRAQLSEDKEQRS